MSYQYRIGGGLEDDSVSGGQGGRNPPTGNGDWEVPGGDDHHHAFGLDPQSGEIVEVAGRQVVEADEVHDLGNLGVRLGKEFSAVRQRRSHEVCAPAAQFPRH